MQFCSWVVKTKKILGLCLGLAVISLPTAAADEKVTYDVPIQVEHRSTDVAPPANTAEKSSQDSQKSAADMQKSAPHMQKSAPKQLSTEKAEKTASKKTTTAKSASSKTDTKKTASSKTSTKKTAIKNTSTKKTNNTKQTKPAKSNSTTSSSTDVPLKKKRLKTHKAA